MTTDTVRTGGGASYWRIAGWGVVGAILLAPLVAMRFTDEVNWTASDFVFAGVLLGGVGLAVELVFRRSGSWAYRGATVIALAAAFLMTWINAAVGIIGNEQDDVNMLFAGVVLVALVGAGIARLRPAGMARAMFATAIAQLLVPVVATVSGLAGAGALTLREVPVLTIGFAGMWLVSAWLYRRSAAG